ncbi:hypothetical protein FOZ61_006638 [Perkinsus olseni]|uniref:Uncharacterized protein n=1 Tax=Perkinsus olseni TaxID=32597 RepID=A0A7J6LCY5_PEROL|nr:hypothetical protein FOZ61_006638 [Perkinsus olseni]KAF4671117.1 hypothetical protein FOL46_000426 [Perkinsus olseni]
MRGPCTLLAALNAAVTTAYDPCDDLGLPLAREGEYVRPAEYAARITKFFETNNYTRSVPRYLDHVPGLVFANAEEFRHNCPQLLLLCLLLDVERSLEATYASVFTDGATHLLSTAQRRWDEYARLRSSDPIVISHAERFPMSWLGWPIDEGERRARAYYSRITSTLDDPRKREEFFRLLYKMGDAPLMDELWEAGLHDVMDALASITGIEYFPYGGTLLALVERDIDILIGVNSPADWSNRVAFDLATALTDERGWMGCYQKASIPLDAMVAGIPYRKDLLQCLKTQHDGQLLLADFASYIIVNSSTMGAHSYFQRGCSNDGRCATVEFLSNNASASNNVNLVYPFGSCRAYNRTVQCPRRPLDFTRAFHKLGQHDCLAIPSLFSRDQRDPRNADFGLRGLTSHDVSIIRRIAEDLQSGGYASMREELESARCVEVQKALKPNITCIGCGVSLQQYVTTA